MWPLHIGGGLFFSQPGTGGLRPEAWGCAGSCSWPSSPGWTSTGWLFVWGPGLVSPEVGLLGEEALLGRGEALSLLTLPPKGKY